MLCCSALKRLKQGPDLIDLRQPFGRRLTSSFGPVLINGAPMLGLLMALKVNLDTTFERCEIKSIQLNFVRLRTSDELDVLNLTKFIFWPFWPFYGH